MKRFIINSLLFFLFFSVNAQELRFEYGKVMTSFLYTNSNAEKLDYLKTNTNNHLAMGWQSRFLKNNNLMYTLNLNMNKYGVQAGDTLLKNYYEWNANYIGLDVGLNFEFFRFSSYLNYFQNTNKDQSFSFFIELRGGMEYLMQGTQTINDDVYNLRGVEQFDKPMLTAMGGLGIVYYASGVISIYAKYNGGMSFAVFKSSDNEKLNFVNHVFSLGLSLDLMLIKKGSR